MFYAFQITTPKNITESSKQKTVLRLERGTIDKVEVLFPPGPCNLLHLKINDALHQVWPTNPPGNFSTDNETISFDEDFPLDQPPYELYAETWNEDDTYEHTLIIRLGIRPLGIPITPAEEGTQYVPEELI